MERDSAQEQYDKMTKTPVHQLVLRLGLPTTVSMLVTSIYNMADTFFVSVLFLFYSCFSPYRQPPLYVPSLPISFPYPPPARTGYGSDPDYASPWLS